MFSFHGLHTHCNLTLSVAIFLLIPRVTVIASSTVAVMSSLNKSKNYWYLSVTELQWLTSKVNQTLQTQAAFKGTDAEWSLGRLSGHRGDQVATGETKWLLGRPSGYWGS